MVNKTYVFLTPKAAKPPNPYPLYHSPPRLTTYLDKTSPRGSFPPTLSTHQISPTFAAKSRPKSQHPLWGQGGHEG